MAEHSQALGHESALIKSSPYLFLSLLVLFWNMITTLFGTALSAEDSHTVAMVKYIFYGLSLLIFMFIGVVCLTVKYAFSCRCKIHTKQTALKDLVHDVIFVLMATLYLAGDNLPVFICNTMSTFTVSKVACRDSSSMLVGISLALHMALYLVGILKIKSAPTPTFPVTGRIRKAYENVLQLGKFTLLIDQTFTTVVRSFTHVDLEDDEIGKCGCDRNTTAEIERCLDILNVEVGVFLLVLIIIISVIATGVVMKNLKDYCSCCWKKMESEGGQCCCHCWENFGIFTSYFLVIVFMFTYTLADNRWLWTCVIHNENVSFCTRIAILSVSFIFAATMGSVYIYVIWVPGVGIVCGKRRFFAEYEYVIIKTNNNPECKYDAVGVLESSPSRSETMEMAQFTTPLNTQHTCSLNNSIRGTSIEKHWSVSATIPIEKQFKCCDGAYTFTNCAGCTKFLCCTNDRTCHDCLKDCCQRRLSSAWESCLNSNICTFLTFICIYCLMSIECNCLKSKNCECLKSNDFDNETFLYAYLGKEENIHLATLSDGKLEFIGKDPEHPAGTEYTVIRKPDA